MIFDNTIFDTIDNGIIILDEELNILAWNKWLEIRTNILKEEIEGLNICEKFSYINEKKLRRKVKSALVTKNPSYYNVDPHEYLIKIKMNSISSNYNYMLQDITIVPYKKDKNIVYLYIYDKTALCEINLKLERLNEDLVDLSNKDYLTKVYNRRYFNDYSRRVIESVKRSKNKALSIVAIDIDYFKNINDNYGHTVGDEVLISVSNILKQNIRKSDIVARFGGEEFILLLNATLEDATAIAEKIRCIIENNNIIIDENEIRITSSFGIATFSKEEEDISPTLQRADDLLYIAKKHGRNKVVNSL